MFFIIQITVAVGMNMYFSNNSKFLLWILSIGSKKTKVVKKKWTVEETKAVLNHMKKNVDLHRVPNKRECMACLEKETALKARDWKAVKYKVHTLIQQQKRK